MHLCHTYVFVPFTVVITCESCVITCLMSTRACLARHVNVPQLRARHEKNLLIELITTHSYIHRWSQAVHMNVNVIYLKGFSTSYIASEDVLSSR